MLWGLKGFEGAAFCPPPRPATQHGSPAWAAPSSCRPPKSERDAKERSEFLPSGEMEREARAPPAPPHPEPEVDEDPSAPGSSDGGDGGSYIFMCVCPCQGPPRIRTRGTHTHRLISPSRCICVCVKGLFMRDWLMQLQGLSSPPSCHLLGADPRALRSEIHSDPEGLRAGGQWWTPQAPGRQTPHPAGVEEEPPTLCLASVRCPAGHTMPTCTAWLLGSASQD